MIRFQLRLKLCPLHTEIEVLLFMPKYSHDFLHIFWFISFYSYLYNQCLEQYRIKNIARIFGTQPLFKLPYYFSIFNILLSKLKPHGSITTSQILKKNHCVDFDIRDYYRYIKYNKHVWGQKFASLYLFNIFCNFK